MNPRPDMPAIRISIAVIMLFQVAALFIRELVRLKLIESGTAIEFARMQSAWFGFLALAILMSPYMLKDRTLVPKLFQRPASWPRVILISVAIGLAMRAVSWGIALVVAAVRIPELSPELSPELPGSWMSGPATLLWQCPDWRSLILSVATMALMTPLIEEFINRGLIMGSLLARRIPLAVPISALLFAVLHRPADIPHAFLFGVVVAYLALRLGNLWGPVIAHSTFNGMLLIDTYCLQFPALEAALLSLPGSQLAMTGLVVIAMFMFLSLHLALPKARETGAGTQ